MPRVTTEVPDTYESITRPVAIAVLDQLKTAFGIKKDVKVIYSGIFENPQSQNSAIGEDPDIGVGFTSEGLITLEAVEDYSENSLLSTAILRPEAPGIFVDDKLGILLRPVYSKTDVTLTMRFRASDEVTVSRWRDDMRIRLAAGREQQLLEVNYHYMLPPAFIIALVDIHRLREANVGYGETLQTYLREHFTARATTITTLAGTEAALAIAESQVGIQGNADFTSSIPQKERGDDGTSWSVSFDYKFTYEKVIGCTLIYPCIIHNQIMPTQFLPEAVNLFYDRPRLQSRSFSALQAINHVGNVEGLTGVTIPAYDDWLPTYNPHRVSLARILLTVDPNDPTLLLDLNELGDFKIHPEILVYLRENYSLITDSVSTAVGVELYMGDHWVNPGAITVSPDLVLRTVESMDQRQVYHLRITLLLDLNRLSYAGVDALRSNGLACNRILTTLDTDLAPLPLIGKAPGLVRKEDLFNALQRIPTTGQIFSGTYDRVWVWVANIVISVTSKE